MEGVTTFDYIFECWKNKEFPDGFDDLLDKYLDIKKDVFSNARIDNPTAWLNKIIIAIEIGKERDPSRFDEHRVFWEAQIGKGWKVSIEDKWVTWG